MTTRLEDVHDMKVGRNMMIDSHPCKIINIKRSAPGKHGHAKYRIEGVGIFDSKKRVVIIGGGNKVEVPMIDKRTAQILSISGDKAQVMDMESYETFDLDIPGEMKDSVVEGVQVMYWIVMDKKMMKQK